MDNEILKTEIIRRIKEIAKAEEGVAPGIAKFQAETGIKPHLWKGKIWRTWSDAIAEAGFSPNRLQSAFDDDELLQVVCRVAKTLKRFPSSGDIGYEVRRVPNAPSPRTILARWKMAALAKALADYAERQGEKEVAQYAHEYTAAQNFDDAEEENLDSKSELGHVYLQKHGLDYKIGHTKSLNKRGRQIQIELPQEIELVHWILTDDPRGVEAYWHKRFADKRTRGEWFKLTKSDVRAFKRWSKVW